VVVRVDRECQDATRRRLIPHEPQGKLMGGDDVTTRVCYTEGI